MIIIHQDKNAKYDQSKLMAKCQYNVWGLEWIAEFHYNDVIMSSVASQITSLTIVYSTVYTGADPRKHQSSASLACVRGIHRWPVNSRKMPVTRIIFFSIWWRHHVRITQLLGKARERKRKRERGEEEKREDFGRANMTLREADFKEADHMSDVFILFLRHVITRTFRYTSSSPIGSAEG